MRHGMHEGGGGKAQVFPAALFCFSKGVKRVCNYRKNGEVQP